MGNANDSGRTLKSGESTGIQLSKRGGKPTINKSSDDESARGFARLPEESMPSSSITSYATTGSPNNSRVGPKSILRSQVIEQHYDNVDSV